MAKQVWNWLIAGLRKCKFDRVVFFLCLFLSMGLMVTGFMLPPEGTVDRSVIICVGELFAFAALSAGMSAISKGKEFEIKHNNTSLMIGDMADIKGKDKDDSYGYPGTGCCHGNMNFDRPDYPEEEP